MKYKLSSSRKKAQVIQVLKDSMCPITIAVDGWTNVRHNKVTNIVPLTGGTAFYWTSITNTKEKNTGVYLANNIKPVVDDMISHGIKIVAVAADNEPVNGKMHRCLKQDFPFLIRQILNRGEE